MAEVRKPAYTTWAEVKKHTMPGGPPESTVLVARGANLHSLEDLNWREFTTILLGDDDRLYIRFVGKPKKTANGQGLHAHPAGHMICIDWQYPSADVDMARFLNKINFLKYGFMVKPRVASHATNPKPDSYFFSVNQREWLDWLPINRRLALHLTKIELKDLIIKREISRTGKTLVYDGELKGRRMIVKKLMGDIDRADEMYYILRDVHTLVKISSPYFVRTVGIHFGNNNDLMVVTEFLPNAITLDKYLQTHALTTAEQVFIANSIAKGMHHLHDEALVNEANTFGMLNFSLEPDGTAKPKVLYHGDLKPSNVLLVLNADGRPSEVKICDVQQIKFIQRALFSVCAGTPEYSAPEINDLCLMPQSAELDKQKQKLDVYSFGVTLWQIITGQKPWADVSALEIRQCIMKPDGRPEITPAVAASPMQNLMERCWAANAVNRPDFGVIAQELTSLCTKQ